MKQRNQDTYKIQPGQIRASEIVAWVLEHRDSYPLPDDYHSDIYCDLPEGVCYYDDHWTNISKTRFASGMRVAPTQVSRWIKAGMPVRADGRLEEWRAHRWVENYKAENHRRQSHGWSEAEE